MYLSHLEISNFRMYGENALTLELNAGLNLLVGENNCGKSTIMDAIRLLLGTTDEEFMPITTQDFHKPEVGDQATEFTIWGVFDNLEPEEEELFIGLLEWVTEEGVSRGRLHLKLTAKRRPEGEDLGRFGRQVQVELRAGPDPEGKQLESEQRKALEATYLKPLRDAERELAARKGSRLSKILGAHTAIKDERHNIEQIMAEANQKLNALPVVEKRKEDLNLLYLNRLKLAEDRWEATIQVAPMNFKGILERLALSITDGHLEDVCHGLGIDNLLFIAAEFLLLQGPRAPLRLALIEEPEAHLHPQLQLRLMEFLETQLHHPDASVQVILTTHSPQLASKVDLEQVILVQNKNAYPLRKGCTRLSADDYQFLKSFLDVTKSNLFFARGVVIVEGPAEQHLIPALAEVLGRSFTHHGVSVVNVGGIGLSRFSKIFQRAEVTGTPIDIRVACVTDRDIPVGEARTPVGGYEPLISEKQYLKSQWPVDQKEQEAFKKCAEYDGPPVKLFVSPGWTLEYDLIAAGMDREVYAAREIARKADGKALAVTAYLEILEGSPEAMEKLRTSLEKKAGRAITEPEWHVELYRPICQGGISKTDTAMYLAWVLRHEHQQARSAGTETAFQEQLRGKLPRYLLDAIGHVTRETPAPVVTA